MTYIFVKNCSIFLSQYFIFQNFTLIRLILLILLLSLCCSAATQAQNRDSLIRRNTGFIDFNGYYDTRDFSVFTINLLANLPIRFQYFGFINFEGPKETTDLGTYYSEHNLRWAINNTAPVELTLQWVTRPGIENDILRLGVRVPLNKVSFLTAFLNRINLRYGINLHVAEYGEGRSPKYFTQIEHGYQWQLFKKRVYLAGFIDHNFVTDETNNVRDVWVTEHQLGLRLISNFFVVAELRINDYLPKDNVGLGYGLQYKVVF